MKTNSLTLEQLKQLNEKILRASGDGNVEEIEKLFTCSPDISALSRYGYSSSTPLHEASKNGYIEVVKLLIKKGFNVNNLDREGKTALYEACKNGHSEIIKILIGAGADTNTFTKHELSSNTPLHEASKNNHGEAIKVMLEAGIDVDVINSNGFTPLHEACRLTKKKAIEELIKGGANVNFIEYSDGLNPLHLCSKNGDFEGVEKLIEAGANINISDKEGNTPLHNAILSGEIKAVKILLSYGANPDQIIKLGNLKDLGQDLAMQKQTTQALFDYGSDITALKDKLLSAELGEFIDSLNESESIAKRDQELIKLNQERETNIARVAEFVRLKEAKEQQLIDAINSGNTDEIIKLVTQENVNVNFFNESKQNPLLTALANNELSEEEKKLVIKTLLSLKASANRSLYLAVTNDASQFIDELLRLGCDIRVICGYGDLIQSAVFTNSLQSIIKLQELGFDLKKKYEDTKTLLHLASQNGHGKVVEFLIANKVDVNAKDKDRQTPLHLASIGGHGTVVELLIANKANIVSFLAKNINRETPLHEASKYAQSEVVKILIAKGADIDDPDMTSKTPLYRAFKSILYSSDTNKRETIKTLLFAGAALIKFTTTTDIKDFIEFLKSITPQEFDEIKNQPDKLKKIEESGFYALLRIANLQCNADFSEQQKQAFFEKILSKHPPQPGLEFLKFPPIVNILESNRFSSENKFKIIEAIVEEPEQFKKSYIEFSKIKTFAKEPIISLSGNKIPKDLQKLILTNLLPDKIKGLDFFRDSTEINSEVLANLVEVFLERPYSSIKPDLAVTQKATTMSVTTI
jgi:ankyrin repeat protein